MEMTKIQKLVLGFVGIVILGILIVLSSCTNHAVAGKIGDLYEKLVSLQDQKQACYDNLNLQDTAVYLKGEGRFCFEWDDEIQSIRAELDELTDHPYLKIKPNQNIDNDINDIIEELGLMME